MREIPLMWGQAIKTSRQEGKTSFIEEVQRIHSKIEVLERQVHVLSVMLISAGMPGSVIQRILEDQVTPCGD